MGKVFKRLPSPSMAVAFVALLAALTGTAVALPGSNSVTSGDIKNSQVKTQDIKNSTVAGKDVKNNTLTGSDVSESKLGKVPSASSADTAASATTAGSAGTAANAGNAGNAAALGGIAAAAYARNLEWASENSPTNSSGKSIDVECPAGKFAITAGIQILASGVVEVPNAALQDMEPIEAGGGGIEPGEKPIGFRLDAGETPTYGNDWRFIGYVLCAEY